MLGSVDPSSQLNMSLRQNGGWKHGTGDGQVQVLSAKYHTSIQSRFRILTIKSPVRAPEFGH